MTIEQWEIDPVLKSELDTHYKTTYALSLKDHDPMDIARALTFDNLAPTITIKDLSGFLQKLDILFARNSIHGVGLEVGSGPGTFVASFATLPQVTKIYGIEACGALVEKLMVKVVKHIAGEDEKKVVGAVADFDHLSLQDNSIDFVFDFFSLHHSQNPQITLTEIARVLKPGGVLICVDKARADELNEIDLDRLLDVEYPDHAKQMMGIDPKMIHTRRMNGEHEYRLKDWKNFFLNAGFSEVKHYNVAKIGGNRLVRMAKHCIAFLPVDLQSKFSKYISKKVTNNLEPSNRIFTNIFPSYPREFSLMLVWKK